MALGTGPHTWRTFSDHPYFPFLRFPFHVRNFIVRLLGNIEDRMHM
jgi:hypothetical protein